MINYDQFCQIRAYREEGLKASQIADKMKLDARTVAKWMDEPTFHQRTTTARSSKLDPFKDEILAMLERHPFSAAQIFQKIKELVFDEMVVKFFLSGLGEHGRRQIDTSQVTCQLAEGGTGQAGAAAEVEEVGKRETSLAMFADQLR